MTDTSADPFGELTMFEPQAFTARSYEWRLHSADDAIEQQLATEVARAGANRAFVITSPSIVSKTKTIARIAGELGERYAGVFSEIEPESTYISVAAATDAAREAGADLLIAVGGGSVVVATRVVDVFLCESGDPFELMTQYPEGKPAVSPRLMAPKLPILNIPTTPTSAMNRAGSGLANPDLDHRMEYFDPKTRPTAIFWDWQALRTTPFSVLRSTATTTFSSAIAPVAAVGGNPLKEGDDLQIFRLARRAYPQLIASPEAIEPRIDLCAAALLQNRSVDDGTGGANVGDNVSLGDSAISTALHVLYPHVGQGESISVLQATVARRSAVTASIDSAQRIAQLLDVWVENMSPVDAVRAVADEIEEIYRTAEMPLRISELGLSRDDFPSIAEATLKNFNANSGLRGADERRKETIDLLEAAW